MPIQCIRNSVLLIRSCSRTHKRQLGDFFNTNASEEQPAVGVAQVLRLEPEVGKEVPRVVERHQDHHKAAENIYGGKPCGLSSQQGNAVFCRRDCLRRGRDSHSTLTKS